MTPRDDLLTPRLRLRRWRENDKPLMAAINRDPEVARYLNRPVEESAEAFFGLLVDHWHEHGFGFYAVELRHDNAPPEFIGFVGVAYPTYLPDLADRPELGWRLARSVWGQGYATEAARAARDDAFARRGLAELISVIHPDNARSRRLAARLGMEIEREVHNPLLGRNVDIWRADRQPSDHAAPSAP